MKSGVKALSTAAHSVAHVADVSTSLIWSNTHARVQSA